MTTQHASKAMIIDGIASAECPDSSFEILRLKGADISTLEGGKAPLSWEHKSVEKDAPNHTPLDVVGVITKAKKIFSEKDCENEREKKYWNSVKVPFLYIIGRLYDAAGHPAAIALAAIIRDHVQNGEPPMVEFSVEGSTLSREGHELTETVLRLVTMTVKPCHKLATSGLLSDPGAPEGFDKSPAKEGSVKDILAELAATYKSADGISHKVSSYSIQVDPEVPSELAKTITAGGMGGAPGSLTGGAALQREEIGFRKRKLSAIAKAIARDYRKEHGDLREVVKAILDKAQMPDVSDEFLNHYTGLIDDIRLSLKKSEPLDKMAILHNDPANPLTVYRVQNEHGDGPYGNMGALDNSHDNPSAQPDPDEDFSLQDNYAAGIQKSKPLYAFKKPEDAEAWFGRPALDRMKKKGFELKPVLASRAWISDSGKQVVFHPSLKKSEGDDEGPPTAKGPLTIRGKAVQPNTGMKTGKIDFDEQNGILHTDRGSFPLYNPDKDTEVPESGEKFKAVWHSPEVRKQHDYATRNWLRVHQALKAGKLPGAVLASAVAFSHLSRNTPVTVHEAMYSLVSDTILNPCGQKPKKIKDFKPGDRILGVDDHGKTIETEVVALHDHGLLDAFEVTFQDGYSVTCSRNHKFLTNQGMKPLKEIVSLGLEVFCASNSKERRVADEMRTYVSHRGREKCSLQELPGLQRSLGQNSIRVGAALAHKKSGKVKGRCGETPFGGKDLDRHPSGAARGRSERVAQVSLGRVCCVAKREMRSNGEMAVREWREVQGDKSGFSRISKDLERVSSGRVSRECDAAFSKSSRVENEQPREGQIHRPEKHQVRLTIPRSTPIWSRGVASLQWDVNVVRGQCEVPFCPETSGLRVSGSQSLGRSGRILALLPRKGYGKTQEGVGSQTVKRSDAKSRVLEKGGYLSDPAIYGMLQEQQVTQTRATEMAYSDAPLSSTGRLVSRGIVRVRFLGKRRMYDLEVSHPKHNFLLPNGVVTSNSHLLDTMKEKGMDPRHPDFGSDDTYQNWINRDTPYANPKSSSDYFLFDIDHALTLRGDNPANKEEAQRLKDPEYREKQSALRVAGLPNEIEGRLEGERPSFQIAANKFADIARYHEAHDSFSRIVQQYGTDTRGAVRALMEAKVSRLAHKAKQRQQDAKGKEVSDWQGEQIVPGLAQKTGRFAYSMLGGGNSIVPDTHMIRHLFGLDKDLDSATNEYLKQRVLWQPKNSSLLEGLDRWYFKNHPSVKYMLDHPEFKNAFKSDPEQANFLSFWAHWLAISKHEESIGRGSANLAFNTQASHRPYFDEFDRLMEHPQESKDVIPGKNVFARTIPRGIKKAESIPGGPLIDPADAAQLVHDWTKQVGHAGALFRYYAHLVPLLYPEEHIHPGVSFHESPFSKSLALEAAVIDLRKSLIDLESLSKDEEGTQPGIPKAKAAAPKSKMPPGVIDAKIHGLGSLNISPEQLKLIHGLDLSKKLDESEIPVHTADGVTEPQWKRHPSGKLVLVKGEMPDGSDAHIEGIARREAAYHNLAKHFFGLGAFVPTTAAVRHPLTNETHSVQEEVPDASHVDVKRFSENGYGYMPEDKRQESWIRKHQVNGDLDKIHVMNMVLGNNDRHTGNLLVTPHEPHVRLIDHSHCFDYHGDHSEIKTPAYFRLQQGMRYKEEARRNPEADQHGQIPDHFGNEPIHPDAAKWLQGLDHEKLADLVRAFGVGEKAAKRASGSLQIIKSRLARNPKIARSDLLTDTAPYESRK